MTFCNIAAIRDSSDHVVYTGNHLALSVMDLAERIINSPSTQWVRCIKTNNERAANKWDPQTIQRQLKALSILELIRFRKLGFAIRFNTEQFVRQYRFDCVCV